MKITGAVIAFNEEQHIIRCLESLKQVCDELVVLDSGSTDATTKLAVEMGASVHQHKWEGFEIAKNKLNDLANSSYVLNLDADEVLSDELTQSILSVKGQLSGAYSMNRLTNYCGKWIKTCGWYPDQKVRLFPKETKWKGGALHEYPEVSGLEVRNLKGDLLHYSYPTVESHKEKIEKYAALGAEKLKGKSKLILWFKYLFTPPFKFLKMYFIKRGFLDGKLGYTICSLSAKGQRRRYAIALGKH